MSNARVAHRYAEAILDAVPESIATGDVVAELLDIRTSIRNSRELQLFFESPIISQKQKADTVDALFRERVHAYVFSVLQLLVEKSREDLIVDIIDTVVELRREREGILATRIHSAVALDAEQQRTLQDALGAVSGKRVEAEYDVDTALIGGLTVRLGDTVYDGSVQHQLKRLRDRFVSGR